MELKSYHKAYYGSLNDEERVFIDKAIEEGKAVRVWDGIGGLMGVSQIKVLNERERAAFASHAECRR